METNEKQAHYLCRPKRIREQDTSHSCPLQSVPTSFVRKPSSRKDRCRFVQKEPVDTSWLRPSMVRYDYAHSSDKRNCHSHLIATSHRNLLLLTALQQWKAIASSSRRSLPGERVPPPPPVHPLGYVCPSPLSPRRRNKS